MASDSEGEVEVAAPAGDEGNHDERSQLNTSSVIMKTEGERHPLDQIGYNFRGRRRRPGLGIRRASRGRWWGEIEKGF